MMAKRKYIILIILLASASACSSLPFFDDGNSLPYYDDFSDSDNGWPNTSDSDGITGYYQGSYRILVDTENIDAWVTPGKIFSDVSIEIQVTKKGGDDNNDFGLICRAEDLTRFYAGVISSDGHYGLYKNVSVDELVYLGMEEMLPVDGINLGAETNQLRLDCIGNTISLYVNGNLVGQVQDSDLTSGDIGLIAGTFGVPGTDILFDNLIVTSPENAP